MLSARRHKFFSISAGIPNTEGIANLSSLAMPYFLIPIPEIQALSGAMLFSVQCFSGLFSRIVYVTLNTGFEIC